MRFVYSRYKQRLRRQDLVARMIFHEARTGTIAAWTHATPKQIRVIARDMQEMPDGVHLVRHRGKSPHDSSYFFRSTQITSHAAMLGYQLEHTGALRKQDTSIPVETLRCLTRGELVCEAFEAYLAAVTSPLIAFEHATLLLTHLACTRELALINCSGCGEAWILDRLGRPETLCVHCRNPASMLARRIANGADLRGYRHGVHPIQLNLFDSGM
ncbi:MAG TPA: hypothetical protein VGM84_26380 [Steroidobacteraceae bacterium]|jgi:hypothetical protein